MQLQQRRQQQHLSANASVSCWKQGRSCELNLHNHILSSQEIINMMTHHTESVCTYVCTWKGPSTFNVSFIFAGVPGEAGQFFLFCYPGFCTLTKAAFTFHLNTTLYSLWTELITSQAYTSKSQPPPPQPPHLCSAFLMLFKPVQVY